MTAARTLASGAARGSARASRFGTAVGPRLGCTRRALAGGRRAPGRPRLALGSACSGCGRRARDQAADDHQHAAEQHAEVERRLRGRRRCGVERRRLGAGRRRTSPPASGCSFASSTARTPRRSAAAPADLGRRRRARTGPRSTAPRAAIASSPATRATALLTPDATPDVALVDRVEHGRGQRRDGHRQPEAEDEHRRQHVGRGSRGRRRGAQQQQADAPTISGPTRHRQPRPDPRRERAEAAARAGTSAASSGSSRAPASSGV